MFIFSSVKEKFKSLFNLFSKRHLFPAADCVSLWSRYLTGKGSGKLCNDKRKVNCFSTDEIYVGGKDTECMSYCYTCLLYTSSIALHMSHVGRGFRYSYSDVAFDTFSCDRNITNTAYIICV